MRGGHGGHGRDKGRGIVRRRGVIWELPWRAGLLSPRRRVVVRRYWRNDWRREIFGRGKRGYEGSISSLRRVIKHFGLALWI